MGLRTDGWLMLCALLLGCAVPADRSTQAVVTDAPHISSALQRSIVITFDDLPGVGTGYIEDLQYITNTLIAKIRRHDMPAIGFVNEGKLSTQRVRRIALLEQWVANGLELGNHTYAHRGFYDTPVEEYERSVIDGEVVTVRLTGADSTETKWFRHPFLNTGRTLADRQRFERFLAEHGYRVAPVTFDNDEWIYAAAYRNAHAKGDTALMRTLGVDYIRYMEETFAFYEQESRNLFGREIPQILLLHANRLNADWLDELSEVLTRRGYRYIPIAEAMHDSAYATEDNFVGRNGPSWLERWAFTLGKPHGEQPDAPEWVQALGRGR